MNEAALFVLGFVPAHGDSIWCNILGFESLDFLHPHACEKSDGEGDHGVGKMLLRSGEQRGGLLGGEGADFARYRLLAFEVLEGVGIAPFAWRFARPAPQAR